MPLAGRSVDNSAAKAFPLGTLAAVRFTVATSRYPYSGIQVAPRMRGPLARRGHTSDHWDSFLECNRPLRPDQARRSLLALVVDSLDRPRCLSPVEWQGRLRVAMWARPLAASRTETNPRASTVRGTARRDEFPARSTGCRWGKAARSRRTAAHHRLRRRAGPTGPDASVGSGWWKKTKQGSDVPLPGAQGRRSGGPRCPRPVRRKAFCRRSVAAGRGLRRRRSILSGNRARSSTEGGTSASAVLPDCGRVAGSSSLAAGRRPE